MTDEVNVPDVAESLLGFRVWRWHEPTLTLISVTRGAVPKRQPRMRALLAAPEGAWPHDKPLVAECTKDHPAPDPDCTCGIYATYDIDVITGYIREAPILGLVAAGGTTVPGDNGFRAQEVRVACLFAIAEEFTTARRQLARLADHYRVPVVVPHSASCDDYRHGVRSGFAEGWQLDFETGAT
jgi:hypothetical protein